MLPQGTLVIADERRPLAMLFGATAEGRGVQPGTERIVLAAIQVNGVPRSRSRRRSGWRRR